MRMKTLNLLLTTGVLLASSFIISVNAQTQSISLDPEEWSEGKNMDIYEEEGNLVLEVWTAAEPAWQETYIRIIDLDLEKYPNFSITTEGDEGAGARITFLPGMGNRFPDRNFVERMVDRSVP